MAMLWRTFTHLSFIAQDVEKPWWLGGVLLCVFGSTLTALGLVLQKFSHVENERKGNETVYYKQPWWIAGFAIFLFAQIVNLVAMAFAPQVMLSALGAWSLMANTLFAWSILRERLVMMEVVAMFGVIGGVVTVILATPDVDERYVAVGDLDVLIARFFEQMFIIVSASLVGGVCLAAYLSFEVYTDLVPFFWSLVSALATGVTAMLYKCIALLLVSVPPGSGSPWHRYETYLIVIAALGISIGQVHALNLALKYGEAMTVVPTYYSLGMLAQMLTAAVFFKELNGFESYTSMGVFCGGLIVLMSCIMWMTRVHILSESGVEIGSPESKDLGLVPRSPTAKDLGFVPRSPRTPLLSARRRGSSTLDSDAFEDSFLNGRGRVYSVSVTGPMGVA